MKINAYLAYLKMITSARQIMAQHRPSVNFLSDQTAVVAAGNKGNVIMFSPHPDDEALVCGLALRLIQLGYRVINVAVTLGSKLERRPGRLAELKNSCCCLGFQLVVMGDDGLNGINLKMRQDENAASWMGKIQLIIRIIREYDPQAIFFPHAKDYNTTHVGVHYLVADAITEFLRNAPGFSYHCFQTEFWHPMDTQGGVDAPNLLVESSAEDVAMMMNATALHKGEVERNPYHLTLPALMAYSVMRGAETIGVQGGSAPEFNWGTIYRHEIWTKDGISRLSNRLLGISDDAGKILD